MKSEQNSTTSPLLPIKDLDRQSVLWLVLMSLMMFLLLLPISSYVAALSLIKEEWGLSNTQAGVIYSAYLAGYAASALFIVPLTDRLGSRHILFGSAVVGVIAQLLFPLVAQDIVLGAILRGIAGVAFVGVYVPGLRIIAERFSQRGRGAAIGLFVTAQYAGHSGSLAITGGLMAFFDWRDAYTMVSLVSFASLPMAYSLLRKHTLRSSTKSSGKLDLSVLKNTTARYLILGYSLHSLQVYAVRVWLPVFLLGVLVTRGINNEQATVTAATIGGLALTTGAIGPFMGGAISDRFGRATSAMAIFALSGICAWLIGWTVDLPWSLIVSISVVYGWAIAADSAIYQTGITEVANPMQLGSAMAIQSSIGFMGGVVGPILFGGILDLSPESIRWGIAFSALGVLALAAIAGLQKLRSLPESRPLTEGER